MLDVFFSSVDTVSEGGDGSQAVKDLPVGLPVPCEDTTRLMPQVPPSLSTQPHTGVYKGGLLPLIC